MVKVPTSKNSILRTLKKYNIVELSIGYAIGGSGKDVLSSLYSDIITPIINTIRGKDDDEEEIGWEAFFDTLIPFIFIVTVSLIILSQVHSVKNK